MKHLFAIFVPLCIICYIGYGVSLAVLGTKNEAVDTAGTVFEEDNVTVEVINIEQPFDSIELDTAFYDVTITQTDSAEIAAVIITRPNDAPLRGGFSTSIYNNTLKLESKTPWSGGFSQFWKNLAQSLASGDFSGTFNTAKVTIAIPEKLYKSLDVNLGSGSLTMNGLKAREIDIDIGSGKFTFNGADGFTADSLELDMGSGKVKTYALGAQKYDIEIGSGNFDLNGLCGRGSFQMGSGSGTLSFAEYNGDGTFEIGSGSLDIELPENANADITASLGSGKVAVNACGVDRTIKDSGNITLGSGGAEIDITVGSGRVNIINSTASAVQTDVTTSFIENYAQEIGDLAYAE